MLDAVADSLEAKGLVREAYEVDKVADSISRIAIDARYSLLCRVDPSMVNKAKQIVATANKPMKDIWVADDISNYTYGGKGPGIIIKKGITGLEDMNEELRKAGIMKF